jgi:hypothetical protein
MSSDRSISSLAAGLVLIVILMFFMNSLFRPTPPVLEIKEFSLDPTNVKAGETAALTINIQSNDGEAGHFLRVEFESHTLVVFFLGSEQLPQDNGKWYFTTTVNPSGTIIQPIGIKAALASGVAEIKYGITVNFFTDGNQFDSRKVELTVRWP